MTNIPNVEDYSKAYEERSFERMSKLALRLVERNETQRTALLTELRKWVEENIGDSGQVVAHLDELIKYTK